MIALGIRYLTKYAVSTNPAAQRAEWPPHPGRVFMAMAAAHFETGGVAGERAALEWLEAAPAPALRASDADERTAVRAYVPVNDEPGGVVRRVRQDRVFPRVRPHDDCVYLIWNAQPSADTRSAIEELCSKVTRIGHSMSAVQMWVVPEGREPEPNWLPSAASAEARLRVMSAGTLRSLEAAFNGAAIEEHDALAEAIKTAKGREKDRLKKDLQARFPGGRPESKRPRLVDWQGYGRAGHDADEGRVVDGPFDENFVVLSKKEGSILGLESTQQLTGALRNAVLRAAGADAPEWLSGHGARGVPSLTAHVEFFPLPYVGFEHADGHVLGLGLAVPRQNVDLPGTSRAEELRRVLGPLLFDTETGEEREIEVWGKGWRWTLEREKRQRPPLTLQRLSWTLPSRTWASVRPVVLHHYPKKREGEVARIVRESFVSARLPLPEEVIVQGISKIEGAGHALALPPFTQGGEKLCQYQTHVVVRFAQRVRGPVLVGRGRYRGYGLFRPLADREQL